jgi:hypothetical protein
MITEAPKGVISYPGDALYAVLLLALFLIVEYALWRLPQQRRSAGKRASRDKHEWTS